MKRASDERENQMRQSYWAAANGVLLRANEGGFGKNSHMKVGLELEASGVQKLPNGLIVPISEVTRNSIIREHPAASVELGASQFEIITPPVEGISPLYYKTRERMEELNETARKHRAQILWMGTMPFVPMNRIKRTDKEKYHSVPDFHNANRRPETATRVGRIDAKDAAIIALCNALQINSEAKDPADAIDTLNRSLMISPLVTAVGANARFLDKKDSDIADLRMLAWERSHDLRTPEEMRRGEKTRVGLPRRYYRDLKDYLEQVGSYPFILDDPDHALQIGIGLHWRDGRIKVVGKNMDTLVVERRSLSMQATPEENLALALFWIGREEWSKMEDEPLMPFWQVEFNKMQAMLYGTAGDMFFVKDGKNHRLPTKTAVQYELARAREGLRMIGYEDKSFADYLEILEERIAKGSPAEQLGIKVQEAINRRYHSEEAIIFAAEKARLI